jgi:hypothetical protein
MIGDGAERGSISAREGVHQDITGRLGKQRIGGEIRTFIIGAYLTSEYKVLTSSGEVAAVSVQPTIRHVHQMVAAAYLERTISYSTVRKVIADERQKNPGVFALAERGRKTRVSSPKPRYGSEVGVKEHLARQRAFVATMKHELERYRGTFQDRLNQPGQGQLVLNPVTGTWEWRL